MAHQDNAQPDWVTVGLIAAGAAVAGALLSVPLQRAYTFRQGVRLARSGMKSDKSGARFERELPKGKHSLQLYSLGTPNGNKVTIALEELGLPYDAHFTSIFPDALDQFGSEFVDINPNSRIPALLDLEGPGGKPQRVFETASILLYLDEKAGGKLTPKDPSARVEMMNWLMWIQGAAPYLGNYGHFSHYFKEQRIGYAITRFEVETKRLVDVLDKHLADKQWVAGDEYSLADIAIFPWIRCLSVFYKADDVLQLDSFENVKLWSARMAARPAVALGMQINSPFGDGKFKNYSSDGNGTGSAKK